MESLPNTKTSESFKVENLERELKEKDVLIAQLLEQINDMKSNFHTWVERTENGPITDANAPDNGDNNTGFQEPTHVARIPIHEDESYFVTYAHFDIHHEMLSVCFNQKNTYYFMNQLDQ